VALLMTVTRSVGHQYHYEPQNRREPFLPLVFPKHRGLSSSSSIEQSRTHEPTWKLLGIISGMHGFYASIQNSEGKRYIVTVGSVIPSERLKVKRISETELEFDYLDRRTDTNNLERSQKLIVSF
jgi:Tfp pilus assembly protein PilP